MVTALSVVPTREVARGSSLINASRLVVQSIGVAVLATVLASAISPERKPFSSSTSNCLRRGMHRLAGLCQVGGGSQGALTLGRAPERLR